MIIINASPSRMIQIGYEGEDRVTAIRFRYPTEWLDLGSGIFSVRVRRHGEHTAYNAQIVTDDAENHYLLMTVTSTELSVNGVGEMQVVYSGANFVKKSPIYRYEVSSAVDEVLDPPAEDVYTQIIESLSDLQSTIREKADVENVSALSDAVQDIDSDIQRIDEDIGSLKLTEQQKTALIDLLN